MPNEKAASIWQKFANYEHKYGDMTGIEKVESRWREAFPSGKSYGQSISSAGHGLTNLCHRIEVEHLRRAKQLSRHRGHQRYGTRWKR
jgi:hypothetical protein